jgi:hypothetical protein
MGAYEENATDIQATPNRTRLFVVARVEVDGANRRGAGN